MLAGFNFSSNASVNDGKWHFIVAQRLANGTGQIDIDGALDSSQSAAAVPLGSDFHVYLGEDVRNATLLGPASAETFVGQIDEVQIYDVALTMPQVSLLFSGRGSLNLDQRGDQRPVGSAVDIGAAEYQYDLAISGSAPAQAGANNIITYTFTIANNGPDPVAGAGFADALPATLTFQSLTAPSGWTVHVPAVGTSGVVTATDTALLAPGASATFTLVVEAGVTTQGTVIRNTASIGPSRGDFNTGNNTVTLSSTIPTLPPAGVDIHGQPANGVVDQPIGGPITVAVVDANGNTVPDSNQLVTLVIASGLAGAKLRGKTKVHAVNGVATFTDLTLNMAGTYTLEATGGKLTPDFSNPFTISPVDVTGDLATKRGPVFDLEDGIVAAGDLQHAQRRRLN